MTSKRVPTKRMNARLFGGALPPPELDILQRYIDNYPSTFDLFALYDWLVLAASMPGVQWY